MPEFQLELGSPKARQQWKDCDSFTQGYIEAAFFCDTGSSDNGDLENVAVCNLSPEAWATIHADCAAFQASKAYQAAEAADFEGNDAEHAGRDFWYTRNGHGVGFWDGDWDEHGDALAAEAQKHRETGLYLGDDGLIYLE